MSQYESPPLFASLHIAATTGGPANNTLLAAPGAGTAYRIVGLWASTERGNTAGVVIELAFEDTVGGTDLWHVALCASAGLGADHIVLPGPGILLGANDLLNVTSTATAITQGCDVGVYYYIDAF